MIEEITWINAVPAIITVLALDPLAQRGLIQRLDQLPGLGISYHSRAWEFL